MTIEEVKDKKASAENQIRAIIEDFKKETGLIVEAISIQQEYTFSKRDSFLVSISMEVKI